MALSRGPAEPIPEVRVAAGVLTTLVFDAPLDRGSVELEGRERFRLVDVGERILALEPAADLGHGERLGLRVRYAGSAAQEQGSFTLATHASEVDTRVEVFRRKDSVELLRAELTDVRAQLKAQMEENQKLRSFRDSGGPSGLILSGMLDRRGVRVITLSDVSADSIGSDSLSFLSRTSFRAPTWGAISTKVRNKGNRPWSPSSARVINSKSGDVLDVRSVRMTSPVIKPNETELVVIETEAPHWPVGELCSFELFDSTGTSLVLVRGIVF